ncbi:hypothetical protein V6N11_073369 [Hibiscus sabdariffa]|uniref:RNase H type-1 domain-containing protein n=1 Tax=Hibiscus sabdariffa TaxID=183260 RepID=A0ABR2P490_9ROSI
MKAAVKINFDYAFNYHSRSATSVAQNSEGFILAACALPHGNVSDASLIALIILDMKELPSGIQNISFVCGCREANNTTHSLAREHHSAPTPYYWIEEVPPKIAAAAELNRRDLLSF